MHADEPAPLHSAHEASHGRQASPPPFVILSCPELPAAGAPASPLAAARCGDFVDVIAGWLGGAATICERDSAVALGAMLGAAALVSTGGSFSFAAGVARGDGAFFAPSLAGVGDFPEAARLAAWNAKHKQHCLTFHLGKCPRGDACAFIHDKMVDDDVLHG